MQDPSSAGPEAPHQAGASGVVSSLLRDHGLILRATVAMERCAARLVAPGGPDSRERDHLGFLFRLFRDFADGVHHAKEEELLIPALLGAGLPSDTGILRDVIDEHLSGTQLLARLTAQRAERALEWIPDFSEAVRNHLRFEEGNLFPLVGRLLDPPAEERVLLGFRQVEVRAGDGRDYDTLDREIERLLAPLDQLYPDRKRPW